jgi:ATP/ADP translocase
MLLLINALALQVSELVAVSGFLSEVGADELLIVWIVDMGLIILAASAQSLVVDRFNRVRLLRMMIVAFAIIYVVLRLMFVLGLPGWLNYSLLFLLSEQQWLFFPLIFWILANDVYDTAQSKRLFPLIASFSFVGQIISMGLAAVAPMVFARLGLQSADLLILNIGLYVVAFVLAGRLSDVKVRQTQQKSETLRETLTEGWDFVREVPSFRYLTIAFLLAAASITIIEYHFFAVSSRGITDAGTYQTFYSIIRLAETLAAVALSAFVAGRMIEGIGLKNVFIIMPVTVMVAAVGLLAAPIVLFVTTTGWIASRISLNTLDQSARKTLQSMVPEERRGRVSMFLDSYLLATGTILGSVLAGLIIILGKNFDIPTEVIYLGLAADMAVFAVYAILRMKDVYDSSLFNWRLKRRQRTSSVLSKLDF